MGKTAVSPTRQENFSEWYQQVIKVSDLAEHAAVRGCMTIKPYGYAIWELIQQQLDQRFKQQGVQNAYFPLLIPASFLVKEAEQVKGFAKECAVVTHHRLKDDGKGGLVPDGELDEPYIIRPTSETMICDTVSRWIQSYRDLPLKLNQWCNIMRWEMRTRLFLRTSEFLWQEGHTFFATAEEAQQNAQTMWKVYADFLQNELALACVPGEKTPEERFPGAVNTYCLEAIMQDNKALQACTSHYLGQNFAKAFNINFLDKDGSSKMVYSSSWGSTTRLIGGVIMTHADDNGLLLPPAIAPHQMVIVPIIQQEGDRAMILDYCQRLAKPLLAKNIRVLVDERDRSNSDKIWEWVKKGAPIRVEIGLKELQQQTLTYFRRDDVDVKCKQFLTADAVEMLAEVLKEITHNLGQRAQQTLKERVVVRNLEEVKEVCVQEQPLQMLLPRPLSETVEFNELKEKYALSRRCIPEEYMLLPETEQQVLVGKAY